MNKERILQHLHSQSSGLKLHPKILDHPLLKHFKLSLEDKMSKYATRKKGINGKNTSTRKNKEHKRLLSDDEITNICVNGQFNIFEGSLYGRLGDKKNIAPTEGDNLDEYIQRLIRRMDATEERDSIRKDFYTFINHTWLSRKLKEMEKLKTYFVQIDIFRIKQDEVYHKLHKYIQNYLKEDTKTQKSKCIRNLYQSFNHTSKKTGLIDAKLIKDEIEYITGKENDMYDLLAKVCSNEIIGFASPVVWSVTPDEKDVSKYASHINVPQLGLYDVMLYIDMPSDDAETKEYKRVFKKKYIKFIGDTFKTCLPDEYKDYDPNDVWKVEYDMLISMGTYSEFKQDPNYYNVATPNTLKNKIGLDWNKFATKLGYSAVPEKIIVANMNATKGLVELMKKNWNTKEWKTYWLFIHFKQMLRFVNDWRPVYFNFYKKFVKGQPMDFTADIYSVFGMSLCFNKFLTEQYMKHNENQQYISYVTNLFHDLRNIFMRRIKNNTWLSPSTKKGALKKLEKIKLIIGRPTNIPDDPLLDYTNDNAWENAKMMSRFKTNRLINLDGKGIVDSHPTIDWVEFKFTGSQAYIVNAYYTPTLNSIYIPMGILQPPFIDLKERGIEYNLANIGYTIGHELSHSLDNTGSKYDEDGNLNDWWSESDRKIFNRKVKDVINQYESSTRRDGIKFDASNSVGEDLADIAGMSLIEDYLIDFHFINDDIDVVKRISFETLYIYLAVSSKQQVYKRALPAQLKQNPHPLNKYRTNCPLSRLKFFRSIFNVIKGDEMWWHNMDIIW
jgi:predicted metalloendopeptidase